ncbi:MAG TPA: RHS repeat-associated core domain-containing protein [Bacteroidales bacterium]|nr:RHS repeat-associated core domain-containing protein [Bacteroidales bacterium]
MYNLINFKLIANAKELDNETSYTYFGARYYDSDLSVWLSVDPMSDERSWVSPYAYCQNNPLVLVDPRGMIDNPIYDTDGNFLGTDDKGLQGEAIIMNKEDFKQGMSHEEAMAKGKTLDNMSFDEAKNFANNGKFKDFINHYNNLSNRPDWDGYLTLKEANEWYRNGNGQPIFVDLSKIDLSNLYSLGDEYISQEKYINLFFASISKNDALVYGTIKLKRYPNDQVKAYPDIYDFEMHNAKNPLNWPRNIGTKIGKAYAGDGIPFKINFYGSKQLKKLPWIE